MISTQVNAELGTHLETELPSCWHVNLMGGSLHDSLGNGLRRWILPLLMVCPPGPGAPEGVGMLV